MSRSVEAPADLALPTEEMISDVVHAFYDRIKVDELLSPIFGPRLQGHWDEHLATMTDFWSSVLLTTGRYRGRPLAVHGRLGRITPAMWNRWVELFEEAATEQCPANVSPIFVDRSRQIAAHLSRSLNREPELLPTVE